MSAINGDGYGSEHDWEYLGSNNSKVSQYKCKTCGTGFPHFYDNVPSIFEARKAENVPENCEPKITGDSK